MKKRLHLLLPLLAATAPCLALLGPATDALAEPCTGSVEEARRRMDRGLFLFDHQRYVEAAGEFDAAYRAQPFSAFLVNAAMAYEKARDYGNAVLRYKAFVTADPNSPDAKRIRATITWLEGLDAAQKAAHDVDGGAPDGGGVAAGPAPEPPPAAQMERQFRSQVVVLSDPPGAPLTLYARKSGAAPFENGKPNPGWEKIAGSVKTPHDVSLGVGDYHIVIEAFKDYKRSETNVTLLPGHIYEFKANLSQGAFLGFLRVTSPVEGARIYVDDPPPHKKGPWGRSPYGALIDSGEHRVWLEAPGYEPREEKVSIEHGVTVELAPPLERVNYGFLIIDANAEAATVKVDGKSYGAVSAVGEPLRVRLPSGPHKLELTASGRKTFAGDVEVPRGQELAVHGRLSFSPPRSLALLSGVLGVGAGVGGWALLAQPSYKLLGFDANKLPVIAPTGTQPYFKIGGGIAFGVAGLLAAATVYQLVSDPTPASRVQLGKPRDFGEDEAPAAPPKPGPRLFGARETAARDRCGGAL